MSEYRVMKISVLLCLLLVSLMEVHSQTEFPYVSFMGETLPNHSYVDLNEVGDPSHIASDASEQCHTDLSSCCSGGQGEHRAWRLHGISLVEIDCHYLETLTEARGYHRVMVTHHLVYIAVIFQLMLSMMQRTSQ